MRAVVPPRERVHAQLLRHPGTQTVDELARLKNGELGPRPDTGGIEQLQRIVMLRRSRVMRIDLYIGPAVSRFCIAGMRVFMVFGDLGNGSFCDA